MTELREVVSIATFTGTISGDLTLSIDGLPELRAVFSGGSATFRPWTCPMAYSLSSSTCGPLYTAWQEIEAIRERLKAEQEDKQDVTEP